MGYTTDFWGDFEVVPPLRPAHRKYLQAFAMSRRMKRSAAIAAALPDPIREKARLPIGEEGGYYVGSAGKSYGQDQDDSIINYNDPPSDQPGLWCQWTASDDGTKIEWDGGEKFYNYIDWLRYIIEHFLNPWGYALCGEVMWQGEESDDAGKIVIDSPKNEVFVYERDYIYRLVSNP